MQNGKILFIATGGTIASAKTENGLTPAITSEELLNAVPQVKNLCAVDTVQPYSLDSTNMCWKQWIHVAEIIRDSYAKVRRLCHRPRHRYVVLRGGHALVSHPEKRKSPLF